jgi:hypothetical protein
VNGSHWWPKVVSELPAQAPLSAGDTLRSVYIVDEKYGMVEITP